MVFVVSDILFLSCSSFCLFLHVSCLLSLSFLLSYPSALVLPAGATYVTMKTPLSELLVDGGKYRFFAFYGQMKPVHRRYSSRFSSSFLDFFSSPSRFTALPWAKKLLIGLAFAIGSKIHLVMPLASTSSLFPLFHVSLLSSLFQSFFSCSFFATLILAVTIVICAVAAFFAFQMKPYADYLQRYLELIVNGCTIAACATLIAFVSDSLKAGGITAVTIIYLIFQIACTLLFFVFQVIPSLSAVVACLGFYLYSWMQLRGIYNFGQCFGGRGILSHFLYPNPNPDSQMRSEFRRFTLLKPALFVSAH